MKTTAIGASVEVFLGGVDDARRCLECREVIEIMRAVTGEEPVLWGTSIIGFGQYHYKYASGREGDFFLTGVAPRKRALTIYIMPGFDAFDGLMAKLGKYKTGKSCLYVNKLEDVDVGTLTQLIEKSVRHMRKTYPD